MLLLDVEGGTVTLRNRKGLDVVGIRSMADVARVYKDLYDSIDEKTNTLYYKTIGIDSLTELQKLDMLEIMRALNQRRPDLKEKGADETPSMREWGITQDHMRKVVRGFRDLPCNTVITALSATDKNDSNQTVYFPQLPGKLKGEITGFLDIVGLYTAGIEDGATVRKLQVAKTQRVSAKDRTGALGDIIQAPSMPLLWELIHSNGKGA